jgi:hypothetical protein
MLVAADQIRVQKSQVDFAKSRESGARNSEKTEHTRSI